MELFALSTSLSVIPYSESFQSYNPTEAASRGNFLVLNQAVPALDELGRNLDLLYALERQELRQYQGRYYPSDKHWKTLTIITQMRENPVLHSKALVRKHL